MNEKEFDRINRNVNNCVWRWEICMKQATRATTLELRHYWISVAERFLQIMEGHLRKMRAVTSMPELEQELAGMGIQTEANTAKDFGA